MIISSLPDSIKTSLDVVKNLKTKPSCVKVASAELFHSCATIRDPTTGDDSGPSRSTEGLLEGEMNAYGARLAVCELSVVPELVPRACRDFIPSTATTKRSSFAGWLTGNKFSKPQPLYPEYDQRTQAQLRQCTLGLSANPSAWTSYSNAKQSARFMCHAMRGELERDQAVEMHKALNSVLGDTMNAFMSSKEEWEEFRVGFNELAVHMRQSHLDLVQDDEQRRQEAGVLWAAWEARMRADLEELSARISGIQHNAVQASNDLTTNNRDFQQAFQQAHQQLDGLSNHQDELIQAADTRFVTFVEYLQEMIDQSVMQGIIKANNNLEATSSLISSMSMNLTELGQELEKLKGTAEVAEQLHSVIKSASDLFMVDLAGTLKRATTVCMCAALITLFSFGIWNKFVGIIGSVCGSIGTGFLLASVVVSYGDLTGLTAYIPDLAHMPTQSTTEILGVAAFVVAALMFGVICRLLMKCWRPRHRPAKPRPYNARDLIPQDMKFRLPINDPRRMAALAEPGRAGSGGGVTFKRWDV